MACVDSTLGLTGLCGAFTDGAGKVIKPLAIGDSATFKMVWAASGLQLGINDDKFADNTGSFNVTVTNVTRGTSWTGTVDGKSMPWDVTINPDYNFGIDDGIAPTVVSLFFSLGDTITIQYSSGTVKAGSPWPFVDANGVASDPTGSTNGSTGTKFPTLYMKTCTPGTCGATLPAASYYPNLRIPSGESQNVNELDAHSSVGQIDAESIDLTGDLRKLAATAGVAGLSARFCMGFPGMPLSSFQTMHTMQLLAMDRSPSGIIRFHLADPQRYTMKQVWTEGGPAAWQPGDDAPAQPTVESFTSNGQPIGDKNPRYLQGNPIDIYLVCMQNELGVGQDPCAAQADWKLYTPGDDSTLINPNNYIDVPPALALRDGEFSGVRFEFKITSAQDAKSWCEDQILKPLGLYHRVLANGQLSLKSMKQPVSTSPFALTDDTIIATPDVERLPIVNVVKVTIGTDDGGTGPVFEFIDQQSVDEFLQQYESDVQADGFRAGWGAYLLSELLSDKLVTRHGFNTPVYTFDAMLKAVKVEVGDFVTITHRLLLDLETGDIGVTNILCEVIDRQPDYSSGKVSLKCADTRFMGWNTAYEIAPVGIPAWSSATTQQRQQYMFISDTNGLNPDGSAGNVIF